MVIKWFKKEVTIGLLIGLIANAILRNNERSY